MPISFACDCGKQLRVGDEHAGKRAKCPACKNPVSVPAPPPPPDPEPDATDEDAAFRALSEGPDPEPTDRSWRAPDVPNTPPARALLLQAAGEERSGAEAEEVEGA